MERHSMTRRCTRGGPSSNGWCPWCYENMRARASHKGHAHYRPRHITPATHEDYKMKRPSQAARPKRGEFVCPDATFLSNYPELAKGLCDPWWDDGKPRKPYTIKISMSEEEVHLVLSDPDSKLVCFTTSTGLAEAFMELETALADSTISWRKSKY